MRAASGVERTARAGAVAAAGRERDAGDRRRAAEPAANASASGADDELALAADDDVHARVRGRLLGQERGVHAAPDDGRVRPLRAHAVGELEAVADLRTAHRGDADEHGVAERQGVVVAEAQVGDARAVAGGAQGSGHVEQLQRHLGVGRALAAREHEQDLPGLGRGSHRKAASWRPTVAVRPPIRIPMPTSRLRAAGLVAGERKRPRHTQRAEGLAVEDRDRGRSPVCRSRCPNDGPATPPQSGHPTCEESATSTAAAPFRRTRGVEGKTRAAASWPPPACLEGPVTQPGPLRRPDSEPRRRRESGVVADHFGSVGGVQQSRRRCRSGRSRRSSSGCARPW